MPDLLDKIFDEETEGTAVLEPDISAQNAKPPDKSPSPDSLSASLSEVSEFDAADNLSTAQPDDTIEAEQTPQSDMLDRIFGEPAETGLQLPDDPTEQDRILEDILNIASDSEVPIPDVERSYETFGKIRAKQKKVTHAARHFHWMPSTEEVERLTEEAAKLPGAPKPVPIRPGRALHEISKGAMRFLERDVGGTFGGTAYNWLGQFIEQGGAAVDWISKVGSKNKDQIYNPTAEAIMATGRNIATYGKESREWWAYQAATGWEKLDEDLRKTDPVSYGSGRLSEGVASSALSVLAVYLSGGAAAPALLNKGVQINRGLLALSAMSAAGGFEHAQNQGENFLWATVHGLADGTIEYVMETSFLEGVGKGTTALGAGLKEGAEEFATGMLQNTRAGILENSKKDMSAYDGAKDAVIGSLKQAPWEVAAGFIGGYGMVGGANLVELAARANAKPVAEAVEEPVEAEPAETREQAGYDMTPEAIRALTDADDRRVKAIEYLDDTSEQWRQLEDHLTELEENDPFQKNPETQEVQRQLDGMIEQFLAPVEEAAPEAEPVETPDKPAEVVKRHAVEILPRKQQILNEIDEAIESAPSEQETRDRLQKEIPEPASELSGDERWKALQDRSQRMADEIKKLKSDVVTFEIDGGANIINTKEALTTFRANIQNLPEAEQWPKKKARGVAKKKPMAAKKETVGELIKAPEGWFTDGRILVKGEPPTKTRRAADFKDRAELDIDDIIHAATEPAELLHYAIEAPETGKGISERPVAHIEERGERGPVAVFKSGEQYFMYDQDRFNVLRNRYPDAGYGIKADTGLLVAYMGRNNPVAAMMPINPNETGEPPGMAEPPVSMEELPETESLVPEALRTPEYESLLRLRDDLQQQQDKAVHEAVDYVFKEWPSLAMPYERAELEGRGVDFVLPFLRDAQQNIDQKVGFEQWLPELAKNAVKISAQLDQYITQLSEQVQRLAALKSRMERTVLGKEEVEASEFIPSPAPDAGSIVVDKFRDWPQQIRKVGKDYWTEVMAAAKELMTPYRYKALRQTLLGVFRYKKAPSPQVVGIELQDVRDALTATHELAHDIDWLLHNKVFPSSIKKRFPNAKAGEMTLRKELKAVSQVLRPDMWEHPKAYIKKHVELMADFISLYILDPTLTAQLAPNLTPAFESKLADNPQLFDTVSRLQESRYIGPQEPAVAEHIRQDFPLPKEFTPLQLNVDMTNADYVKAAEQLGITAARHYKLLLHRADTQAQRIDKLVPNKDRQTDLVVIAENGSKNPWTGRTKEQILEEGLTPDEEKSIKLFRAYQEQARQTVNKYLRGADVAEYIKFIEDYFLHAYHTPMTEKYKTAISRWAKRSPQAKKRVLPDLATAVELGLKPRAKTLSEGLKLWAGINYRVMTNKAFLRILPNITNDDGLSILQKPQDFPHWPTVDYWPIRQNYAIPLKDRGVLLFQGRVAVDPRVKPFIDAMFGHRHFSTPVRIIEGLNATWKAFELTLFSFFHHQEEFFSAVGALGPRALPVVGGYYGEQARAFGKEKPFGFLPRRIGILQAGKQLEHVPEFMEDYIAHGGQVGYISTEGINLMERMLKSVEDYFKTITQTDPGIVGKAAWLPYVPAKGTRFVYSWFQHLLWDNVQRAKLVTYYQIVGDGAKNSDLPMKDVKEITASYINDNYGGQEWLNTVFRNPKTRQFWTQLMMSLDWTWSQIKTARWPFMHGAKTEQEKARQQFMRKIGRHHWFWYTAAISGFTIAGSFAFSGKGPWDNEKDHKLDIDWTKVWRSLPWNRDWEQRGDYNKRYISLGKAGRELVRWVTSPLMAFGYKLSPVARSTFEQTTGYNVGSSWAEPWAREDLEGYQELYERFKHLMENFKPFSLSGNNAFLAFPSRKGMTDWKATRAFEDIYDARAKIATGGIRGKIAELDRILVKDDQKLRAEIVEACKLNQVDAEQADRRALSGVRSKYYRKFWEASKLPEKEAIEKCNRYAKALIELRVNVKGFVQSLRYRKAELPTEAKKRGIKTMLETAVEKRKEGSD